MAGLLTAWRKYRVVILFPTFVTAAIYADWSHTQKWKAEQISAYKSKELLQQ